MGASDADTARPTSLWSALWLFAPDAGPPQRFVAAGLCAALAITAWVLKSYGAPVTGLVFIMLAYVSGGLRALNAAIAALRERRPDINFLMILAAVVSALVGHWDEGAILLFLFSLSDALERYAIERTRRSIRALVELRPETACVVREERELTVRVEELAVGDLIRVRPGERFAIDGQVVEGVSAVNESIVTGESMPVDKQPESPIFAGTINENGSLLVRMTKPADESTLARIAKLVEEAQERKAPVQRVIEKWEMPYVLGVLGVCGLTILFWMVRTGDPIAAVRTGMILLVAASPCAVVLASPVAVLAAVTRGARQGVLFKGGSHIERLAAVDTVAFDKTGTLTFGRPTVTSVLPSDGYDEQAVLTAAAAVERRSEHPLAQAIVRAAEQRGLTLPEAVDFIGDPGVGVSARVNGRWVRVGRRPLFDKHNVTIPQSLIDLNDQAEGQTAVMVLEEQGVAGVVALSDEVRPEAPEALAALREIGVHKFIVLTGDQRAPTARVAEQLGIEGLKAGLLPEDKVREVRRLIDAGAGVAMIGDGVNDAPALAAAQVGIAMGAAGTDVALETADVVLMGDDLRSLAEAVHIARRCRTVIQQGLLLAFGVITLLVGLTLLGVFSQVGGLTFAVIGHEGSTVLVVLNGLRLLGEPSAAGNEPQDDSLGRVESA